MHHWIDNLLYAIAGGLLVGYVTFKIKAQRRYLRQVVSIVGGHRDELKFVNILDAWVQSGELTPLAKDA